MSSYSLYNFATLPITSFTTISSVYGVKSWTLSSTEIFVKQLNNETSCFEDKWSIDLSSNKRANTRHWTSLNCDAILPFNVIISFVASLSSVSLEY